MIKVPRKPPAWNWSEPANYGTAVRRGCGPASVMVIGCTAHTIRREGIVSIRTNC